MSLFLLFHPAAKKRRLTFIECNNDINCMIDLAKVVDLVLLLVDASFGFEMETFEFLNICQVRRSVTAASGAGTAPPDWSSYGLGRGWR